MSQPQHMIALKKANEVRFARVAVKRDLWKGRITLADAFEEECVASMPIFDLLRAQYRWAEVRTRKALALAATLLGRAAPLPENKTVGSLTDRQKQALVQACERRTSGV
jgi:hypothetical protein